MSRGGGGGCVSCACWGTAVVVIHVAAVLAASAAVFATVSADAGADIGGGVCVGWGLVLVGVIGLAAYAAGAVDAGDAREAVVFVVVERLKRVFWFEFGWSWEQSV